MSPQRSPMSDAEREVLNVLWENGPLPVRAVLKYLQDEGNEWSRSTVITLLQRLEKKGYVESDKSRSAFVFRPAVSREDVMHARLVDLAGELSDGDAMPLVLAFAERHAFSSEEIQRFQEMIDKLRPAKRKRGKR